MKMIAYWRNPTESEIAFGYGCEHYRNFELQDVQKPDGTPKRWVQRNGHRYYLAGNRGDRGCRLECAG